MMTRRKRMNKEWPLVRMVLTILAFAICLIVTTVNECIDGGTLDIGTRHSVLVAACAASATPSHSGVRASSPPIEHDPHRRTHYDVLIYKANPGGVAAAIAVADTTRALSELYFTSLDSNNNNDNQEDNKYSYDATIQALSQSRPLPLTVAILEPSWSVGGMATSGGIGLRDGHDDDAARMDPRNSQYRWGRWNAEYYGLEPPAVVWQPDHWVGDTSFRRMLDDADVDLLPNTDILEGARGVVVDHDDTGRRITAVVLDDQNRTIITARVFIDASYEGDLMRAAGIDYTVGRESKTHYQERWGGVTSFSAGQFSSPINPFRNETAMANISNRDELLLPYVTMGVDPLIARGDADDNVMAYSYRVCLTKDPLIRVALSEPENYNPDDFELVRRLIQSELSEISAGNRSVLSEPFLRLDYMGYNLVIRDDLKNPRTQMKYDACCGNAPVGIDAVGIGRAYANATRSERIRIARDIQYYVHGLMWFYQTDPVVPAHIRRTHAEFGLCGDEWVDNQHFPPQLYIREAARMVGDQVFTQHDRLPRFFRTDSVAVGSWGLDIHEMQRVAVRRPIDDGEWQVVNEGLRGDQRQGGTFPFEIPYWVILPKREQAVNVAVICTPSVSHVAFSAIREEPTLWQLGQAAGVAAAIALDFGKREGSSIALHDVDVTQLQWHLQEQGAHVHCPSGQSDSNEFETASRMEAETRCCRYDARCCHIQRLQRR